MAFNIIGNLIWESGVGLYNHATLSQGLYSGNRIAGTNSSYYDIDINSPHAQTSIQVGQNYASNWSLIGKVVLVPVAAGTVTLH